MKNWDCEIHVGWAALAFGAVTAGAVFLYFGAA